MGQRRVMLGLPSCCVAGPVSVLPVLLLLTLVLFSW